VATLKIILVPGYSRLLERKIVPPRASDSCHAVLKPIPMPDVWSLS